MSSLHTPAGQQEAQAFCSSCPTEQEVTDLLTQLGFQFIFHLPAFHPPPSSSTPNLPAQYHYAHEEGDEVIFLAGYDIPETGQAFPPHASRFWAYSGAHLMRYQDTIQTLSQSWPLTWLNLPRWLVISKAVEAFTH